MQNGMDFYIEIHHEKKKNPTEYCFCIFQTFNMMAPQRMKTIFCWRNFPAYVFRNNLHTHQLYWTFLWVRVTQKLNEIRNNMHAKLYKGL